MKQKMFTITKGSVYFTCWSKSCAGDILPWV